MGKVVTTLFGGGKVKRDKRLEAAQRRQQQQAANERAELEAEKADVSGTRGRVRSGRALLTYVRQKGRTLTGAA